MYKHHIILVFFILFQISIVPTFGIAQFRDYGLIESELKEAKGVDKVNLLIEICQHDITKDQVLCMLRAREALKIANEINDSSSIAWSLWNIGLTHHYTRDLDSARYYYDSSLHYFKDSSSIARTYSNIATLFDMTSKYDSAYYYLDKAESLLPLSEYEIRGTIAMTKGNILLEKGNHSEASPHYFRAKEYFEQIDDIGRVADAITGIGSTYGALDSFERAIVYLMDAKAIYEEVNDPYYGCDNLYYIGHYYNSLEKFDSARHYFQNSLDIGMQTGNHYAIVNSLVGLADLDEKNNQFFQGIEKLNQALDRSISNDDKYNTALVYNKLGNLYNATKNLKLAKKSLENGLQLSLELGADEIRSNLYNGLSDLNEKNENYKLALFYNKRNSSLKDSLSSIERAKSLQDILAKYETEKKEAQIVLLNKQSELDATRKKGLFGGIILVSLLGLASIFGLIQRSKKKQVVALEKRNILEKELEFKKKELLAKVIQLSKKNEFLHNLEQEVNQLKSTVGGSIAKSTSRIDRMITNDAIDEEEWNQFSKEFSSVHEGFIQKMTQNYGTFTQSEIRLISLLKMNLSSKEIANILRISDEGIKKARYRLRKKMNLETGDDLQGLIISL